MPRLRMAQATALTVGLLPAFLGVTIAIAEPLARPLGRESEWNVINRYRLLDADLREQLRGEERVELPYGLLSEEQIAFFRDAKNRLLVEERLGLQKYKRILESRMISDEDMRILEGLGTIHLPLRVSVPTFVLEFAKLGVEEYSKLDEKKRLTLECAARIARYRQSGIRVPDYCKP